MGEDYCAFAEELAAAAGRVALEYFRRPLKVDDKAAGVPGKEFDPVTEADRAAERLMREMIAARYPDHGIAGEEFADTNAGAELVWVLDPIDGTKSFLSGFPLWGTLIGLMERGRPVLGLMSQPSTGEIFVGWGGKARYRGPAGARDLKTRACGDLAAALLTTTSPQLIEDASDQARYRALEEKVRLARYGGDCYGYCMLADGQIDLVAETGLKLHDIAALIPIIEGAGGVISDWQGGTPNKGGRILASGCPSLHEAALEILNS